jgi:hypothetical protein
MMEKFGIAPEVVACPICIQNTIRCPKPGRQE